MSPLALLAAAVPSFALIATPATPGDPVAVTVSVPATVAQGATFAVAVNVEATDGYELHATDVRPPWIPTELTLTLPEGWEAIGPWSGPPAVASAKPGGGGVLPTNATFVRRVRVAATGPVAERTGGRREIGCSVRYQACDAFRCLRPTTRQLKVAVVVP